VRLCVHGLGYVGLATAALFANNGHDVVGFDTDPAVRRRLERGDVEVAEDDLAAYVDRARSEGLTVSDSVEAADYHMVCVPTPYESGPDLRYVEQAADAVAAVLRPGDTVVVESTVPPETTTDIVQPKLDEAGVEYSLAYAPETILPGNTVTELRTNDRIIGGVDDESAREVADLYESVIDGEVHIAPDATTAECVKLAQNAFRDVNIAFANELALVADDDDIDARETIRLANTHPRVDVLRPGPGVGGHCLPVDPLFLTESGARTQLIEAARAVNDGMADHVVSRLREELGSLAGTEIAVLGVAYKGNVAETRNSPGLAVAQALESATVPAAPITDGGSGTVTVRLADPHATESYLDIRDWRDALDGADAAVFTTDHDEYANLNPGVVAEALDSPLVLDAVDVLDESRWADYGLNVVDL